MYTVCTYVCGYVSTYIYTYLLMLYTMYTYADIQVWY